MLYTLLICLVAVVSLFLVWRRVRETRGMELEAMPG